MIKTREDLDLYLREDAVRNGMAGVNKLVQWVRRRCGSEKAYACLYLRMYRKWEYHANNHNKLRALYYEIRTRRLSRKLGLVFEINTVGYGIRILHIAGSGGMMIRAKKVGNYCSFNTGVVIGTNGSEDARPTLGDRVAFGPGAKAFGDITIGENAFVAANAVVVGDLAPNAIYGGIPAKLIRNKQ